MSLARLRSLLATTTALLAACGTSTVIEPTGATGQIPGTATPGESSCVAAAKVPFAQGTMIYTAVPHDLAVEGRGFFVVEKDGRRTYTRDGSFYWGPNGHLRRADGSELLLAQPDERPGELQPVRYVAFLNPQPTSVITLSLNLDARAKPPAAWDITNPSPTSNYAVQVFVVDSRGNGHFSNIYFRNTGAANTWEWHATVDGGEITGGTPGSSSEIAAGVLAFNLDGTLNTAATVASSANFVEAVQSQAILYDFGSQTSTGGVGIDGATGYGADFEVRWSGQDGHGESPLRHLSFDERGILETIYSDGRTLVAGRVPLVRFDLPSTVIEMGEHRVAASACSGPAQLVWPGESDAGWLLPGFVELR